MTSPVLLLDVDGVLNGHPRLCGWDGPPRRIKAGFPIYYEPRAVERLRVIHTSGLVEIRWSTTWCGYPVALGQLSAQLDLPFEPAFGNRRLSETWADLKVEAALAVLAEGRRLIWVDDCEAEAGRLLYPGIARAEQEERALLVCPDSDLGLRPEHLDAIEEFATMDEAGPICFAEVCR